MYWPYDAPMPTPVEPRPASSTLVLRDGHAGLEVAMLQRHSGTASAAGAWVFPGGGVDASDHAHHVADDQFAERTRRDRLAAPDATAYYVAAVRELFEEAGVLLTSSVTTSTAREQWRAALLAHDIDFPGLLTREKLTLDLDALLYIAHWRTPEGRARRFDTRFFLVAATDDTLTSDGHETIAHEWCRPSDALARGEEGAWQLLLPTRTLLGQLTPFESVGDALDFFRRQPRPALVQPVEVERAGRLVAEIPPSPELRH